MFTMRRATLSDVDAMHALQMRAFAEEGRLCGTREIPPLLERPESIVEHVESHVALVATQGVALLGCVRGVCEAETCTVRALVVEPAMHGQGLGSALLRALESALHHTRRMELTTNTLVEGNVAFYERHGYKVHGYTEPFPGIRLAHLAKTVRAHA